jgi:hypothetical protein
MLNVMLLAKEHAQHARRTSICFYDAILALTEHSDVSIVELNLQSQAVPVKLKREDGIPANFKDLDRPLLPREEKKQAPKKKMGPLSINTNLPAPMAAPTIATPTTAGGSKLRMRMQKAEVKEMIYRPDYVPNHLPAFPHLYTYSTKLYTGPPPQPLAKLKAKIHHDAYLALDALRRMVNDSQDGQDSHATLRLIFPEVLDVANYELAAEAADIASRLRLYAEVTGTHLTLRTIFDSVRTNAQTIDDEEDTFGQFRVVENALSRSESKRESQAGSVVGTQDGSQAESGDESVQGSRTGSQSALSRQEIGQESRQASRHESADREVGSSNDQKNTIVPSIDVEMEVFEMKQENDTSVAQISVPQDVQELAHPESVHVEAITAIDVEMELFE